MAAVNNKGHCYVWSLSGGADEQPTKLSPKHKLEAHPKYALRCKFSPDSRYIHNIFHFIWLKHFLSSPRLPLGSHRLDKVLPCVPLIRFLLRTPYTVGPVLELLFPTWPGAAHPSPSPLFHSFWFKKLLIIKN